MDNATVPESAGWRTLRRGATALGSAGLIVAMASDALAVIGRHAGFAFLGAIEIFQMSALVATASAIVVATLHHRHAAVHVLTERVSDARRHQLGRVSALASAIAFALFAAGSIWVSADLWHTHEMTELLAIPLRPFRLFWIVCALLVALHFAVTAVRRRA